MFKELDELEEFGKLNSSYTTSIIFLIYLITKN